MGAFGAIDFGIDGGYGANLSSYNISFFDKYVRGMNVDLTVVRYFVMGRNKWQESDTWPLSRTEWQRYYLHSKGHANTSEGDGYMNGDKPDSEPEDIFVYNPHMPVPTTGRRGRESIGFVAGPLEQSHIEKRNDVLCFSTSRLGKDTEITGPLELHLYASTTARDTDFCAKVCDVYPDGSSFNVATGIIRARYRKSIFEPELVKPGEINEYIINLGNVSQVFKKGHRIRVDTKSSNFPEWDRNMNTGNPSGEDDTGVAAMQTIYHMSEYASYIDLPVIP
jgi:putative CocE/NonD family hydrolase